MTLYFAWNLLDFFSRRVSLLARPFQRETSAGNEDELVNRWEMVKTIGGKFNCLPTVKTVGYGNQGAGNILFREGHKWGPKKMS